MVALPSGSTPRIAGGDTLVIHNGQYMIGFGAPSGAEKCSVNWPYDCVMASVPSGPDAAHPTRIVGEGYNTGCSTMPQLWGTQRIDHIVDLARSNHVQVACMEITDHEACAVSHSDPTLACQRSAPFPATNPRYPYGYWAAKGLYAADSTDVQLTDINIHGLAHEGMSAARLKDWTLTRVRIAGNAFAGWDGDLGVGLSSNSGTIKLSFVTVEWNGCVETYGSGTPAPTGCFGQSAGGYGDGIGTGSTGGNWVVEDSKFLHNVSDGLDLLYADGTGSVTVNRVWAEGNAGNQLKVSGQASITNSVAVGNCGYFSGKSFTYNVDNCRALGDAVAMRAVLATDVLTMVNTTVIGEGNVAVLATGPAGSKLRLTNNILIGKPNFVDPSRTMGDVYWETPIAVTEVNDLKQGLHSANCTNPTGWVCGTAGLVNDSYTAFDPHLTSTSLARDTGVSVLGVPSTDYYGTARPTGSGVDKGAVEFK